MIIVFLILSILLTGFSVFMSMQSEWETEVYWGIIGMISGGLTLIIFVAMCIIAVDVSEGKVVDKKIAMYQEENEKIEADINNLVKQYMQHEKDTFETAKNESTMTLVSLYPELKSDKLVIEQMKTYKSNNKKIKELKEEKIDLSVKKWWLYFGK